MEIKTKSDRKIRERYKKKEDPNLSKITKNLNLTSQKDKKYIKNREGKIGNEKSEEKTKEKKEQKEENEKDIEKEKKETKIESVKKELLINKKNQINNYKSLNYFLSDSETTVGDTLNDNSKKKYVYRKAVTKKNFSFAINNIAKNKMKESAYEKNKAISSTSLNKYINNSKKIEKTDNNINTNNNFYRKTQSLLDNYRSSSKIQNNLNKSIYFYNNLNNSIYFYNNLNKSRNYNDINCSISSFFEKNDKMINIEDLLILEEKFNEVLISVKSKNNTPNECFELLNSYQQSSIYNNFENYFKDNCSKQIIQTCISYLIYNVIICYHFSFDYIFFNTCYQYLESILELNYKSYLLLCELILLKISSNSKDNIWVDKLRKMLKNKLKHIELNNKEYIDFLMSQEKINYKNPSSNILLEIKYYSNIINKYLQLFLNSINSDNTFKNEFCLLFDFINKNNLSEDKLLYFFKSKIIRVINQNASVAGIEESSYKILIDENNIEVPYLKFPCTKKFSLVLDLDETLISFRLNPNDENKGTIRFRPYLDSFLKKVKEKYELIVFTSGTKDYADPLEDAIEQEIKYFDARLYRQHTIACGKDIVKDISRIGRDLDKIIIVENIPQNYRLQKENGILIKSFYGEDIYDNALVSLGDILIKIANEYNDVRIGIAKYKNEILDKVSTNLSKKNNIYS